jgi:hypothetical protein
MLMVKLLLRVINHVTPDIFTTHTFAMKQSVFVHFAFLALEKLASGKVKRMAEWRVIGYCARWRRSNRTSEPRSGEDC